MEEEKNTPENKKISLITRYREMLISKLTRQDLEEFQTYLRHQYDPGKGWDPAVRLKFELKLREYFHEEVIRREISGIEALLEVLTPEDLTA